MKKERILKATSARRTESRSRVAEFFSRRKAYDESEDEWIREYDMGNASEVVEFGLNETRED